MPCSPTMRRLRQANDGAESARLGLSGTVAGAAFAITLLATLAPLFFATYPPLHDYPAHLARVDILARWRLSPELQRWYDMRSFLLPNVGMDLLASGLARIVPVAFAGRLFVGLTLALTLGGTVMLHRVLFGRFALWPLVSAFFLFNWMLLYGFLNYIFGVALLLWATAAWIALARSDTAKRVLAGTCFTGLLFFCHFVALAQFAIVVAGQALQTAAHIRKAGARGALRELWTGAAIFVAPLVLFLFSSTAGQAGSPVGYRRPILYSKIFAAWRSCMAGDWTLDGVLSAAVVAAFAVILFDGRWRIAPVMRSALVLLVIAFLAAPERLFGALQIDERLPVAAVFLAIGSVDPVVRSRRLRTAATAALALLLLFRAAHLAHAWHDYDGIIRRFTRSFATLPEGSVLFVASTAPIPTMRDMDLALWQPPLKHVVSLAGLERAVFVPATWAHRGQQPITVTERFRPMYEFQGQNPIRIENSKMLGFLVGRLRRLAAAVGEPSTPLYLLVLYPGRLEMETPAHADAKVSDPWFTLLALSPPAVP